MKVLILAGIIPFACSFYRPLRFYSNVKSLCFSIAAVVCLFGVWDVFATWRGHWHFSDDGVIGVYLLNLLFEEVLFFVVIPFCCIFTWEVVDFFKKSYNERIYGFERSLGFGRYSYR